ncbi:nicotinate phosphoribosyltransferase [Singulisphaera acidiphila]|uniref:Nicotinate phosphoribosyltransferase n=1 Tax=Singulisphaera acidiphila (strain ATCC BAA-1392 / DSM 18658 / VKM B-2454 / MOB10) TaxID=886293 RepID=L0DB68_SINAD|nr:nicotinate phosphoribosyltransferase [Singulisphaera acidiphila]AGA26088.1 putative nicotinate phosphoribosyltransferase [Singulisphaera acidiphila DSM 18658]
MFPAPPVSLWPDPDALGAATDLYQVTMMAGYAQAGKDRDRATFEMFVRRLPDDRSFLVFAGLEQAIGDLLRLAFSAEQVDAIRRLPALSGIAPSFFDSLLSLRFEGDVWAAPEGSVVFAGEPLIRVEAPLSQAQWVETFLLASIGYPTLVASKAARLVEAAQGRPVFDFGARRGHGPHAGYLAARAAYIAGCAGTSHVEAAIRLGIPCVGTMAHSWVQAFPTEAEAFQTFAEIFPNASTLLVDTYDTEEGVRLAAAIEPPIQAIRLDSGDLSALAFQVRAILDAAGRTSVKIIGSGDLNEAAIARLVAEGAPFDSFGVGTDLITSRDAPSLSIVYKLVELNGEGRIKRSTGKKTYPMAKQVYRFRDAAGRFSCDRVTKADEKSDGVPLLVPIVRSGELVGPLPRLDAIRAYCREQLASLPEVLRGHDAKPLYPLAYSFALEAEAERLVPLA